MKDLARLKGKGIESIVQPSQDNRDDMVKKLEKGSTVTCFKCHQKGHKSNKCPQQKKAFGWEEQEEAHNQEFSHLHQAQPEEQKQYHLLCDKKRRPMARWLLTRLGRRKGVGTAPFGCSRKSSPTWRGLKWCGFQRRLVALEWLRGIWRLSLKVEVKVQAKTS